MRRLWLALASGAVALGSAVQVASCATNGHTNNNDQSFPDGAFGGSGGAGGGTVVTLDDGAMVTIPSGGSGGSGPMSSCAVTTRKCSSNCTDFPSAVVIDAMPDDGSPATPANAATYFSAADGSGPGPCLVEPTTGTLIPQNWVRPRFRVVPASGQNLFEITLTTMRQANSYVIYTTSKTWKMPKTVWDALRADSWGDPITVTIRGVSTSGGAPSSTTGTFTIAPANAGGSMIYWAATGDENGLSWLEGFGPGDESVATTLTVGQVKAKLDRSANGQYQNDGGAACIGCHSAPPDGNSVTFVDQWPWPGSAAIVNPDAGGGTGAVPRWLTPSGAFALSLSWLGVATYSKTDWVNEQFAITSYGCPQPGANSNAPWSGATCSTQTGSSLAWINLASAAPLGDAATSVNFNPSNLGQDIVNDLGMSWGFLARTGDSNGAEFPNWSHDGTTVAYVSTNVGQDGRLAGASATNDGGAPPPSSEVADIYTIPFNAGKGGQATPVQGASSPGVDEYYPSFSEDDKFIAFDRAAADGAQGMYYDPYAEVYVVPASGAASPTRLAANDPPACEGVRGSPGVTNSWPKWAPDVESCPDGNTYYWLVFSSTREGLPFNLQGPDGGSNFKMGHADGPTSQLYITSVTVANGTVTTSPALYIWNQATKSSGGSAQSNHTPVWEDVTIPRPPPPPPVPK
jgi:hypothetical protein